MHPKNNIHCAVCDSTDLANLGKIGIRGYSVTSDTQICAYASNIYFCENCGLLQKNYAKDELSLILKRYAEYTPHHLSGGREQLAFPEHGVPQPRTAIALQHIEPLIIPSAGKLLDFGTGNGALLKSATKLFSNWIFDAYDINNSLENEVTSFPQFHKFYTGNIETLPMKHYDLITLWHVLEHIDKPLDILRHLKQCLTANGYILLQVPDISRNPFDLAVIDHTLHFNNNNIHAAIKAAGFDIIINGETWFHNCLTLLIKPSIEPGCQILTPQKKCQKNYVDWLKETCRYFEKIANKGHYAIFGTGMASIWISSQLSIKADCFIDEDKAKHGKSFQGIPIVGPSHMPVNCNILLPFLPETSENIIVKLVQLYQRTHFTFCKAPPI